MARVKKVLYSLIKTIFFSLLGMGITLVLMLIVLGLWNMWKIHSYVPYETPMFTSTSPCQRFTVSFYPSPTIYFHFAMPGQGGDGPALIILRDNRTGKELQRQHVDGPWFTYNTVDWYEDHVQLARGDGIVWRLPP